MNEIRRVYCGKIPIIIILVVLNLGMFLISCAGYRDRDVTLTGEELESYISSYPDFLRRTEENAKQLSALPMYRENGFGAESMAKAAEKYSGLTGLHLKSGDNFGVVLLINFGLSDILLTAFLAAVAIGFQAERRKGLVNMVRATAYGRGRLCAVRIIILGLSAVLGGVLLYGGNFLGTVMAFEKCDLSRAVQSLPEFMECPYRVTIGEFLLISFGVKIWAAFTAGLVFYLLTSVFRTAAAFGAAGIIGAAQMLLYKLLIPVSRMNGLKYINIFAAFDLKEIFSACRFINMGGSAAGALDCLMIAMAAVTMLLCTALMVIHGKMQPVSRGILEGISERFARLGGERIKVNRTVFGWELRKILINGRGIIFLGAALLLTLNSAKKYDYVYPVNPYESEWYGKFEGIITEEMIDNIAKNRERLEWNIERTNKQIENCMSKENPDNDLLGRLIMQLEEYTKQLEGLLPVQANAEDGLQYSRSSGREVWLIKPYAYELLFKKDMGTLRRVCLYALIGVIAAVSGVYAYDRQNGMGTVIHSAYKGRRTTDAAKLISVLIICFITCSGLHLIQLWQIGGLLGYNDISAPLQSLECMRDFPLYMPLRGYIILLFAVRGIAGCAAGGICTLISRFSPDTGSAMGISAFLLVIPAMAAEIFGGGMPDMIYFLSGEFMM
ncbi:MAG: hypothetical protein K2N72_11125 [Oscillospiraceae bacterium]|nr:hypothetical protein [Oscillospiraceae bacterium]